jgi:hypothetical protein
MQCFTETILLIAHHGDDLAEHHFDPAALS